VVNLEASDIPAFQTEDYMPPENEMKSRVDFIYSEDTFEKDPDKYWKKVGKKRNDQLESFIGKRKAMDQAVAEIVSSGDSPEVKLQKIYSRVQQIRNTSYEVEKTEQEQKRNKEKDPTNVETIWKKQYGNGAELTWLFLALARAAGFEASGMWLADRSNYFFMPESMDGRRLDANVVVVKLNGKDIFLDPGAAFTPFGILPWVETAVKRPQ
jgi:transglutaminase-like putative cysteine protease